MTPTHPRPPLWPPICWLQPPDGATSCGHSNIAHLPASFWGRASERGACRQMKSLVWFACLSQRGATREGDFNQNIRINVWGREKPIYRSVLCCVRSYGCQRGGWDLFLVFSFFILFFSVFLGSVSFCYHMRRTLKAMLSRDQVHFKYHPAIEYCPLREFPFN